MQCETRTITHYNEGALRRPPSPPAGIETIGRGVTPEATSATADGYRVALRARNILMGAKTVKRVTTRRRRRARRDKRD